MGFASHTTDETDAQTHTQGLAGQRRRRRAHAHRRRAADDHVLSEPCGCCRCRCRRCFCAHSRTIVVGAPAKQPPARRRNCQPAAAGPAHWRRPALAATSQPPPLVVGHSLARSLLLHRCRSAAAGAPRRWCQCGSPRPGFGRPLPHGPPAARRRNRSALAAAHTNALARAPARSQRQGARAAPSCSLARSARASLPRWGALAVRVPGRPAYASSCPAYAPLAAARDRLAGKLAATAPPPLPDPMLVPGSICALHVGGDTLANESPTYKHESTPSQSSPNTTHTNWFSVKLHFVQHFGDIELKYRV